MTTYAIGIDIGGTKIAGALVDTHGTLHHRQQTPTPATGGSDVVAQVNHLVQSLRDLAKRDNDEVIGIGIGSAGVVDSNGVIVSATDLIKNWAGTAVGPIVEAAHGLPVTVLNDVHASGLAEGRIGAAQSANSAIIVGIGTGIGGALVHNGVVSLGSNNVSGALGHVTISRDDTTRLCSCGVPQHVEPYASGPGMERTYRELTGTALRLPQILTQANQGDPHSLTALNDGAIMLGNALGTIINIIDPDLIVIAGGVSAALEHMRPALTTAMHNNRFTPRLSPPIIRATLGADACLIGAALLAHPLPPGCGEAE